MRLVPIAVEAPSELPVGAISPVGNGLLSVLAGVRPPSFEVTMEVTLLNPMAEPS